MNPPEHVDAVIVGSGFGGAVAACRLAAKGLSVVVLERGRRWTPDTLPQRPLDFVFSSRVPHRLNGWLDIRLLDQMVVATGAGVGGGSLIYANVCIDAPDKVFETGWPSEITAAEMTRHYRNVADMLRPNPVPADQLTPRITLLHEAAAKLGVARRFEQVPLAVTFNEHWSHDQPDATNPKNSRPWRNPHGRDQGTCVHCGNCVIGCPVGAKNTLDLNYLADAERHGARIRPLSMVSHVERGPKTSWLVHYQDIGRGKRNPCRIAGDVVILAAGSLGSTEILLRSRDGYRTLTTLPRSLGKGWSPNGDFLTLARYPGRAINPTIGPTIAAAIDLLGGVEEPDDSPTGVDGRLFVEDGGLPNLAATLLGPDWRNATGWRRQIYDRASNLTDFSDMIPWFGQAIDGADGEFRLRSRYAFWRGRLRLNWNPQRSARALDTFSDTHIDIAEATGGIPIPLLTWKYLRMLITPHPLGGCNMASAPGAGVTEHSGEVFGHENLYVMDGAVIPRALGKNPSKTIAAVAERSAELLLAKLGRS